MRVGYRGNLPPHVFPSQRAWQEPLELAARAIGIGGKNYSGDDAVKQTEGQWLIMTMQQNRFCTKAMDLNKNTN